MNEMNYDIRHEQWSSKFWIYFIGSSLTLFRG